MVMPRCRPASTLAERDSATDLIIEVLTLRQHDVDHVIGLPNPDPQLAGLKRESCAGLETPPHATRSHCLASVGRHHPVKLRHNVCDRSSPRGSRCAAPFPSRRSLFGPPRLAAVLIHHGG